MQHQPVNSMRHATRQMSFLEQQACQSAPGRPWFQAVRALQSDAKAKVPAKYQSLAETVRRHMDDIPSSGDFVRRAFPRLVLCYLAKGVIDGTVDSAVCIPPRINELLLKEAHRILSEAGDVAGSSYGIDDDFFKKDLAIVAGRLLPAGAELIQLHSGIPRSLLFRGGRQQFAKALRYFYLQRRGFLGYCALHLDGRRLEEFNPEGWKRTYLRIAELIEMNPSIHGIFGSAWFYDPAVSEIAPHLAYLRTVREAGGARNFYYGRSFGTTDNALSTSRRRSKLYQQGRYQPKAYYLVWHRRELLAWAKAQ